MAVNEDDAALRILSIAPIPSGGSRLAWMDTSSVIHVTTLDACDKLDASHPTFTIPGFDYGDILADNAGGVILVTRAAKGADAKYCGAIQNLCGNVSSLPTQYSCWDMYMVRFDGSTETWATQLSKSTAVLPPYLNSATDSGHAIYIWQAYAHHGRLAYDGTNYAGYYGAAQSVGNQKCAQTDTTNVNGVDIHQGDEMQVVGPTGTLLTGHNSFDWGCSHSGFEKILWDPSASRYVMICRSDAYPHVGMNVNATNLVYAIDQANSSLSNLALASDSGYWILVSNTTANDLMLFKFSTGAATSNINLGTGTKPHLVRYGSQLLATWNMGTNMVGQLLDAATGAKIGATFAIAATNNQFSDFREYPDHSVAYPAQGSSANKLKIVRVWPCE